LFVKKSELVQNQQTTPGQECVSIKMLLK